MTGMNPSLWDRIYKRFEGSRLSIWNEKPTGFLDDRIRMLSEKGVRRFMDAGCGDGRNTLYLAEQDFEVVGVDSSFIACEKAKYITRHMHNVKIINEDLASMNFDEEFDAIFCDYVMVHLEQPEIVLDRFYLALKKAGILIISFLSLDDPSYGTGIKVDDNSFINKGIYHRYYDAEMVKGLLKRFKTIECVELSNEDPEHTDAFPRDKGHWHHSIFVVCEKE